jgi:dihydroorotase
MNSNNPSAAVRPRPKGYVLRGGTVIDGVGSPPARLDVRLRGQTIAAIGAELPAAEDEEIVDTGGLLVTPGLIDLHAHVYDGMGLFSVDPAEAGRRTGVTTLLDAGSAGALTFGTFRRYVMPAAAEDVYALLNIAQHGVQGHPDVEPYLGDLHEIRHLHAGSAIACIRREPDRIIGTKVRLTASLADGKPENEFAALRGAVEVATWTDRFCMVHHLASAVPLETVLEALRPGDVLTHVYHPHPDHGFDTTGAPLPVLLRARERGIRIDVGHGVGSFVWEVGEPACRKHGFWPDTISTDIHQFNLDGPVFDLPTTLSKFLYLGMPLPEVIQAATSTPARQMGLRDRGNLAPGQLADVALMRIEQGRFPLADAHGVVRTADQRLTATGVFKRGVFHSAQRPEG